MAPLVCNNRSCRLRQHISPLNKKTPDYLTPPPPRPILLACHNRQTEPVGILEPSFGEDPVLSAQWLGTISFRSFCWEEVGRVRAAEMVRGPIHVYHVHLQLPYCGTISSRIGPIVGKFGLCSVYRPVSKLMAWLWLVKVSLGLWVPGAYRIPCLCGQVYIARSGQTVIERISERQWYIRLKHQWSLV